MIELVAFVGLFVLVGGISVAVGMIVAGRLGRRLDPPAEPPEPSSGSAARMEERQ